MQPDHSPRGRHGSDLSVREIKSEPHGLGSSDPFLSAVDRSSSEGSRLWSPTQIAAKARAAAEAGARRIGSVAGPSRAERQAVFGKAQEGRTLEGLARLWAEKQIGKRVVVMMGAGVSTGAGIPDIRDRESRPYAEMERQHGPQSPQDLLTKQKFIDDPGPLCSWLGGFLEVLATAQPTASHVFLKVLSEKGLLLRCYTKNIDGLEVAAGVPSERVVMTHGSLENPLCAKCGEPADEIGFKRALRVGKIPQCCRCLGPVQPDLVFVSESAKIPREFQRDLDSCDLLLMMGTSLQENPFAALAARVRPLVPRVLLHHDKVLIADCRHQSRQLDFDSVRAYRDLWLGGDCDETVRHLVSLLAWQKELQALEHHPGARGKQCPCSSAVSGIPSPTPFAEDEDSISRCSTDCRQFSGLSDDDSLSFLGTQLSLSPSWDRMSSRNKLPPPSSAFNTGYSAPAPGMPKAVSAPNMASPFSSTTTVCSMISEEDEDSDTDMFQMQMIGETTTTAI